MFTFILILSGNQEGGRAKDFKTNKQTIIYQFSKCTVYVFLSLEMKTDFCFLSILMKPKEQTMCGIWCVRKINTTTCECIKMSHKYHSIEKTTTRMNESGDFVHVRGWLWFSLELEWYDFKIFYFWAASYKAKQIFTTIYLYFNHYIAWTLNTREEN